MKEWKRTWCCVCSWCSLCAPLVLGSMAEKALGRRFHSETVREMKEWKRTWCCACSWCSLCAPLVLGSMAEKALGRRFHSGTALGGRRNERGHGAVSVPAVVFVFLWSWGQWQKKNTLRRRFHSETERRKKEWKRTWFVRSLYSLCPRVRVTDQHKLHGRRRRCVCGGGGGEVV